MTDPVTIVTPSFNQGAFIRATIESVLSQDYSALEYIIIDNRSTDETTSVVRDYSSRIKFISEPDSGQSEAINKGFRLAKGEIVTWLNSDDVFLPGAVSRAVSTLNSNPQYAAVYGEGYLLDRNGAITGRFPVTEPFNLWKLVHLSDYVLQQTTFFRRSIFEEIGYVDEDLHYVMDWDLLIRIGKRYEIGYIPEFMGCLREYPEAKSFAGGRARIEEIERIMKRHTGLRFAPGYLVYGLDAYRKMWCEAIRAGTPAFLRWPSNALQWAVDVICQEIIGFQILRSQGWYGDRCAGKRVRLMTPASVGAAIIQVHNPDEPARLDVMVEGRRAAGIELPAGDSTHEIPVPAEPDAPKTIELHARGFTRPTLGPDGNARYYRLDRVSFALTRDAVLRAESISAG